MRIQRWTAILSVPGRDVPLGTQDLEDRGRGLPPLRVGLVVGGLRGPRWWDAVVRGLAATPDAELIGYHVATDRSGSARPRLAGWILNVYRLVDGYAFGRPEDPTDVIDLSGTLASARRLESFETDVPDMLVLLGVSRPGSWSEFRSPFGVWSFEHDRDALALAAPVGGALPPGGEELLRGEPSVSTRLVASFGSTVDRRFLGQVVSRVDRLSMRRGSRGHLRKLPTLLIGAVHDLRMDGSLPETATGAARPPSASTELSTTAVAVALMKAIAGYLARLLRRAIMPTRWVVGVSRDATRSVPTGFDLRDLHLLAAPPGREWADPFPVALVGRDVVFVEEYVRSVGRGRIAVVELDDSDRGWRSVETILESPSHLSYPFVFQWEGSWYLLPEQASTRSLELYRAESFPDRWRWHSTILTGIPASDPTVAEIEGRWWLFVAISVPGGNAADELHLFHAETPLGPWTPHDRNPVVSDVRTARPAGRIYEQDGRWFRPAQNGERTYGHSIVILEIEELDVDRYREREVATIRPTWLPGLLATHTINFHSHLATLDGLVREARFPRLRRRRTHAGAGSSRVDRQDER